MHLATTGKFAGRYKCWPCGPDERAGGDVLDLVIHTLGLTKNDNGSPEMQAIDWLNGQNRHTPIKPPRSTPILTAPALNEDLSIFAFQAFVERSDDAARYLIARGLGSVMDEYRLGSTDSEFFPQSLLPLYWDSQRGHISPHRNFLNRLIIPYPSLDGVTRHLNARALDGQNPKYLKVQKPQGGVTPPYLLDELLLADVDDIWVTEAELDCLSLLAARREINACAIAGVNGLSASYIPKFAGRTVWVLMDNDEAGHKAAEVYKQTLSQYASTVHIVRLPPGCNDVNQMLVEQGKRFLAGWLEAVIKKALHETVRKSF
jgi:hypothetical protein